MSDPTHSHFQSSPPDLNALFSTLHLLLAAAARLSGGARVPDCVHLTETVVRLCLDGPVICSLPNDKQRDVVAFITGYISVLALRPLPSTSPVERVFSTAANRARVERGHRLERSDAWVSPQGVYYPLRQVTSSETYHMGLMLHHGLQDQVDEDSESDVPDLD
ncbi:hypothetical protein K466DRAFT_567390 [Polyporus arcularius HHB13444]|uniref:Uncharacterized protein n=1 Tax=Polyporus arcularius HHB13444 TaxID=1314778 RepID=A0A5C3P6D2_9APHY|nr:hypothetical protein K466DRAFT_567390 [Polyporus arcularius HHB13444]